VAVGWAFQTEAEPPQELNDTMSATGQSRLPEILEKHEADLLSEWTSAQMAGLGSGRRGFEERQVREYSREFVAALRAALQNHSGLHPIAETGWAEMRNLLERVTETRLQQGYSPSEVATIVLSFKQPLFAVLRNTFAEDAIGLADETWFASADRHH
jgi:rsbT co-antagonist protein RsbR